MGWFTYFTKFRHLIISLITFLIANIAFANADIGHYHQHNLVSDGFLPADHIDPNLVNPWGVAFGPTTPAWVADNGTGKSTIYDGLGNPKPLVVTIPSANIAMKGTPTGIVFNNTSNWPVTSGNKTAPSVFIFVTEDGTISGWSPNVNQTAAIIAVNNSATHANYKGITRGANGFGAFLYAANFYSGKIDIFDSAFNQVNAPGAFVDPFLPKGYAPFNVRNLNGYIFVAYAKQNDDKDDAVKGDGLGVVSVFDPNGRFLARIATGGPLNAPWGLAIAPAGFGRFSNHLLIGNFGDGKINAYDLHRFFFRGHLHDESGKTIVIDGLWALRFGNGFNNQPTNTLFFSAGPDDEAHGLYGAITPV